MGALFGRADMSLTSQERCLQGSASRAAAISESVAIQYSQVYGKVSGLYGV
jgi:hypothetical protein